MVYTYKEFDTYLRKVLTHKRYVHSHGVADMSAELAEIYGVDVKKARLTGLIHDIAKCYTVEETNSLIRKYDLPGMYLNNPALAHSKIGVAMLKSDFGIEDDEILMGVSSHTTGRAGMTLFEEIIYVADAIEINRDYPSVKNFRKLARTDLDAVCLKLLEFTIRNIRQKGRELDTDTLEACEYMRHKCACNKEN